MSDVLKLQLTKIIKVVTRKLLQFKYIHTDNFTHRQQCKGHKE